MSADAGVVDSHGVGISWQAVGDPHGAPVLVVHGFGSNRTANWLDAGWAAPLEEAGLRGILVDLRGHGASDRPVGAEHYTPDAFLDDLVAVLDDRGMERAGVLGYSLGSRLGWELALRRPERVSALVLGGFGRQDPLATFDVAAARRFADSGEPAADPGTAGLLTAASLVQADLPRIVDAAEGLQAARMGEVGAACRPSSPALIAVGERDVVAVDAEALAAEVGARYVTLGPRSHASAITARGFKRAAVEFLGG